MPNETLWYWPTQTVCAVGKGGKKNTEKHPCFTVALLTRCSNHNTCQWYLLLTTVVTLQNHWLISQLPSCSYWHRLFLLVYLYETVSSSPLARARLPPHKRKRQTPTKTVKWNLLRHTHTYAHTHSLNSTEFIVPASGAAGWPELWQPETLPPFLAFSQQWTLAHKGALTAL